MTGEQMGFGFDEIEEENRTAHLPGTIEKAIPYYRRLLQQHHDTMLAGDEEGTMALRREAHDLAEKVNGGDPGTLAHHNSPGYVLERETAAPKDAVPMWGQTGNYVILVGSMPVRIEQEGIFGIGSNFGFWPGFGAHVVEPDKPFLSETGYRSFLGNHAEIVPGMTPDRFAAEVCRAYIERECNGKTRRIGESYAERIRAERQARSRER